jgi:hypothetical protein
MSNRTTRNPVAGEATFGLEEGKPQGLGFDVNENPQILDSAGTAQATASTSGLTIPTLLASAIQNTTAGGANSYKMDAKVPTVVPSSAATSVLQFTIPNVSNAFAAEIKVLMWIADSADAFESARIVTLNVVGIRVAGGAAVLGISAAGLAQIATVGSGATFTVAATVTSMTGAVGATQTGDVQLNFTPSAGTPNYGVLVLSTVLNAVAGGVTLAAV